jgi:hypothetical protein
LAGVPSARRQAGELRTSQRQRLHLVIDHSSPHHTSPPRPAPQLINFEPPSTIY